ncbi:MAG: fumarylacetoacetate hydrolase family protein [Thermoguttaceae bacterium]|nr:fumarylacetoacetate hydrolase family protein [Thermoguttaceae bacterium]
MTIDTLFGDMKPTKILCIGLNYADHAAEFNDPIPSEPVVFNKAISTLNVHEGDIVLPATSTRVDYEAELVVVMGQVCRNVSMIDAMDYVYGFTCGNDVSARDWQKEKPAGQWFLGKSFDTFAPVGPRIVPKESVTDPNNLHIESRLNGKIMQSSNTKHFIYPLERLVSYISSVMTLMPGDLIFTGTPGGVGDMRKPPVYMRNGDTIEVEIEQIGVLKNRVIAATM